MVLDSTYENKELYKKYDDVLNRIRDKLKEISSGECDYGKNYMRIQFNSDDNLPLNKPLKFHNMTITIRSVFKADGKLYPQVFLDDTLILIKRIKKILEYGRIEVNKRSLSLLVLDIKVIFVMDVMI